ncbi:MAG: hypothetical protein U5M23_00320 [Marinagarivorans sp.]|nr:hypothetical protein [Marinagarivorans sp.]
MAKLMISRIDWLADARKSAAMTRSREAEIKAAEELQAQIARAKRRKFIPSLTYPETIERLVGLYGGIRNAALATTLTRNQIDYWQRSPMVRSRPESPRCKDVLQVAGGLTDSHSIYAAKAFLGPLVGAQLGNTCDSQSFRNALNDLINGNVAELGPLSLSEIGDYMDCGSRSVGKWARGERAPRIEHVIALANGLEEHHSGLGVDLMSKFLGYRTL